jgi:hypothetical protein
LKDKARIEKKGKLSPELQQEIAVKIRFFENEAKAAYIQTLSGVLSQFPDQAAEIFGPPGSTRTSIESEAQRLACDINKKQFVLEYEGEPERTRCMDITTDPEYKNNLFDKNIDNAIGYTVDATTWENIQYKLLRIMLVNYKNKTSEYFMLDQLGNFYYGGQTLIVREFEYLKRKNGLIYPVAGDHVYFSQELTPNNLAFKNGLYYPFALSAESLHVHASPQ